MIIAWLKRLYQTTRLTAAQKIAWEWKCESLIVLRDLGKSMRKMEKLRLKFQEEFDRASSRLEDASRLVQEQDHVEEALNREIQIYKDVILPDFALAREVIREQQKADLALYARQQASLTPEKKE